MEDIKNEVAVNTEMFGSQKDVFYSKKLESVEDRKAFLKAVENADVLLSDVKGEKFVLVDVYTEKRMVEDETTGELKPKFRTILFDETGKTYATGAYGVYSSLKSIFFVYGLPSTWKNGIPVEVAEKKLDKGRTSLILKY